ncbi:MAG: TRAP transporter fused permease subunit [Beijerinckiaceae bacterium]|nr:TRAP transporter fused permease subunit [Beijerinckiaceae bacterium]
MLARRLSPVMLLAQALLIGIIIGWVANLPTRLSISLYTEQFLAASLGLALLLTFLHFPGWKRREGEIPLVDIAAGLAGFAACFYIALRYPVLVNELVYRPWDGVLVGATIVLLILEATRRTAGLALVIVIGVLCLYAYFGNLLPGVFGTRPVQLSRLAVYLGIDTNAVFGTSLQVALITVAPFVLMGQILTRAGGGDFFTDISTALMGRFRGGSAKIAVFGSALFGMISGSAVANVAGVGMITIPLMKRAGFPPQVAASIEAVGSTGGQLMPPVMGAAAFLIAEYLQISYASVVWAALLPAVLYYAALFVQVDLEAAKRGISGTRQEDLPKAWLVLREGWQFPLPFMLLIGGLLWLNMAAEYAALLATVVLLVFALTVGYRGKRLTIADALSAIVATGATILDLIIITAAAGLVIGVLNMTGLAFGLTDQLLALSGNNVFLLLLISAFVAIILGMGMPTVGVYVIMATLAAPALIKFGLEPMQAHLFLMYFGMMSMVTPPVALAAFAAANIAQTDPWKTGWTAMRVGWSAYIIPFLFALSPSLLMQGPVHIIILSAVTAILGVTMGSVAVVGFLFSPVATPMRFVYMLVGLALLIPADAFAGAFTMNVVAIAVAVGLIGLDWMRNRGRGAGAAATPVQEG